MGIDLSIGIGMDLSIIGGGGAGFQGAIDDLSGLVLDYPFTETGPSTVTDRINDYVGSTNNLFEADFEQASLVPSDPTEKSIKLAITDTYIEIPSDPLVNFYDNVSGMILFQKVGPLGSDSKIFVRYTSGGSWQLYHTGTELRFLVGTSGNFNIAATARSAIDNFNPHILGFAYRGSDGATDLYLDGSLVATVASPGYTGALQNRDAFPIRLGEYSSSTVGTTITALLARPILGNAYWQASDFAAVHAAWEEQS